MQAKKPSLALHQAQQARFALLNRVMVDVSISLGARVLYWQLDNHARVDGRCWPKETRLAALLGVKIRSVKYWLEDLRRAGYVKTTRASRSLVYQLCWFEQFCDVQQGAHQGARDVQNTAAEVQQGAHQGSLSLYETSQEARECVRCGGEGWFVLPPSERSKRVSQGRTYTDLGDTGLRVCGCIPMTMDEALEASAAARRRA